MNDEELLRSAIAEHVKLSTYQEDWPVAFARESARLSSALPGVFIAIEHIGSTAVVGMPAKPIIDILAGVKSMSEAERLIEPICRSGYTTSAEFNASLTDRKWFMRFSEGRRTHHLHVAVLGSAVWQERLLFRDVLRSRTNVAASYIALKSELASVYEFDREAYTNGKTNFVRSVLSAA